MTLTIQKEEDDKRQMKLTIEVDEARVERAMRQKANELAREIRIPGFRKGKAPYGVIVRRVGREYLRIEAVEDLVDEIFREVLAVEEIEPYAQPSMDDLEIEPLVMKFTVPLEPVVTLGAYREIRKEIEPIVISDEAVEEALEQVQTRHQTVEPVDRPIQAGDLVTFGGKGEFLTSLQKDLSEELEESQELDGEEDLDVQENVDIEENVDRGGRQKT